MKIIQFFLLLLFVFSCVSGCGERSKHDVTVVTGTVTVDGQPMGDINIIFHPIGGEIVAFGSTDAQGKYRLSAPQAPVGAGAVPGEYAPTFSKTETEQRPAMTAEEEEKMYGNTPPKVTHLIPEKYEDKKTCGVAPVKVEKGKTNVFDFQLSTK